MQSEKHDEEDLPTQVDEANDRIMDSINMDLINASDVVDGVKLTRHREC